MLGNGDIRSIHELLIQFLLLYFGVRRPGLWVSRTVYIHCACLFSVSVYDVVDGYILVGVVVGETYTAIYTYHWRLGLAGSRHLAYLYVLVDCFTHRRPVPIFGPGGLLSVK